MQLQYRPASHPREARRRTACPAVSPRRTACPAVDTLGHSSIRVNALEMGLRRWWEVILQPKYAQIGRKLPHDMRRMAVLRLWRSLFPPFWRRWPWLTWWRSRRTTPSTHRRRWAAHLLQQGHLKDMSLSMVLFPWLRGTNTSSAAFSLEF